MKVARRRLWLSTPALRATVAAACGAGSILPGMLRAWVNGAVYMGNFPGVDPPVRTGWRKRPFGAGGKGINKIARQVYVSRPEHDAVCVRLSTIWSRAARYTPDAKRKPTWGFIWLRVQHHKRG